MSLLILGLLIFLGVHSVRIVAEPWRAAQIARIGPTRWKGLYALTSAVGLVLFGIFSVLSARWYSIEQAGR